MMKPIRAKCVTCRANWKKNRKRMLVSMKNAVEISIMITKTKHSVHQPPSYVWTHEVAKTLQWGNSISITMYSGANNLVKKGVCNTH